MEYNVERILKKRICNGEGEYLIKWSNFSKEQSTWEPRENLLNCQAALDIFESSWAKRVIRMEDELHYIMQFKCGETRAVTYAEAKKKWPQLIIEFCQRNLFWLDVVDGDDQVNGISIEEADLYNLNEIVYVTNSRRGIRYLLKNDSNQYKYISGSEMKWRYVDLLINFYEKNQPKIDIRSFKGRMKDPKIVIQKVAKFEKRVNVVNAGAASAVSANVVTVNAEAANTSAERNVVIDDVAVDSVAANPLAVINVPVGDVAIDAVAADTLAENNVAIDGVSVNAKVANAMRKFRRNTAYLEKKSTAVPLNAKGRKRRQSMCLMDDIKENQGKKVVCRGGNIAREGILVDLSNEPSTSAGPAGPSKPSSNLQRIFDDLQGINFNTKVDRQLPALIPIKVKKPTLAAQIILNVLNANGEMIDENELRYSGESD